LASVYSPFSNIYTSNGNHNYAINTPKIEMRYFANKYTNVFIINSSGDVSLNQLPNGINTIYYDVLPIIIGFDDRKNYQWRLKNELN
jgi:hypothetical protein